MVKNLQLEIGMGSHQVNQGPAYKVDILEILKNLPVDLDMSVIKPLSGGSNNRVFLLEKEDGQKVVAKLYYRNPNDIRDRLQAEFDFLQFAVGVGVRNVPYPIWKDSSRGIGIYSYISGSPVTNEDMTIGLVKEAALLFNRLNQNRNSLQARKLPSASEACFSIAQHIAVVDKRLERLGLIQTQDDIDAKAVNFVDRLSKTWLEVKEDITNKSSLYGYSMDMELQYDCRCLSPSDFGFHNTVQAENEISFIDFEYAGWDDPAKMIADFFCQPAIPVSFDYFENFTNIALDAFEDKAEIIKRANLLLPLYKIKWCCIMLNEFLPSSMSRRSYAHGRDHAISRKEQQLNKADNALNHLNL